MKRLRKLVLLAAMLIFPLGAYADTARVQSMLNRARDFADRREASQAAAVYQEIIRQADLTGASKEQLAEAHYMMTVPPAVNGLKTDTLYSHLVSAAYLGHPAAQRFLAYLIINQMHGQNADKNTIALMPRGFTVSEGLKLLHDAMLQGEVSAFTMMAKLSRKGQAGLLMDPEYADQLEAAAYEQLSTKAAAGDAKAMEELSEFTARGTGVTKDPERAKALTFAATRLYEDQAKEGDVRAMRLVGRRYLSQESPLTKQQNMERAIFWNHQLVIENPVPFDLDWLASFYKDGDKLPQNLVLAHALYNFSSTLGASDWPSKQRDLIAQELSEEQLSEAVAIARVCVIEGMAECLASYSQ